MNQFLKSMCPDLQGLEEIGGSDYFLKINPKKKILWDLNDDIQQVPLS